MLLSVLTHFRIFQSIDIVSPPNGFTCVTLLVALLGPFQPVRTSWVRFSGHKIRHEFREGYHDSFQLLSYLIPPNKHIIQNLLPILLADKYSFSQYRRKRRLKELYINAKEHNHTNIEISGSRLDPFRAIFRDVLKESAQLPNSFFGGNSLRWDAIKTAIVYEVPCFIPWRERIRPL